MAEETGTTLVRLALFGTTTFDDFPVSFYDDWRSAGVVHCELRRLAIYPCTSSVWGEMVELS